MGWFVAASETMPQTVARFCAELPTTIMRVAIEMPIAHRMLLRVQLEFGLVMVLITAPLLLHWNVEVFGHACAKA